LAFAQHQLRHYGGVDSAHGCAGRFSSRTTVVSELALIKHPACRVEDAELVMGVTPVEPDEHPASTATDSTCEESSTSNVLPGHVTERPAVLEPHHGARSATPAGHYPTRLHQEGQVCIRASKARACIGPLLVAR